ncbi:MAG: TauD/TfdA family dioxygenase [Caulobacteraceae bacterium]
MTYQSITVDPVTPFTGAEVSKIDLTRPLSNAQVEDIHQALARHGVLFFRDQPLDLDMLKRLGRHFGELQIHSGRAGLEEHPEVRPIYADANSEHVAGEGWHTRPVVRAHPADGQHPAHAGHPAGRRRHPVRQHVRGLRGAVAEAAGLPRDPHRDA